MKITDMIGLKGLVNEAGFQRWGHDVDKGEEFVVTGKERHGTRAECTFKHRNNLHQGNGIFNEISSQVKDKYFLELNQFELKEEYQKNRTYER